MLNRDTEGRGKAEVSASFARHKVEQQMGFIASLRETDPRLEASRALLRQMEQNLASADLNLALVGYDGVPFGAQMKAFPPV